MTSFISVCIGIVSFINDLGIHQRKIKKLHLYFDSNWSDHGVSRLELNTDITC